MSETQAGYLSQCDPSDESPAVRAGRLPAPRRVNLPPDVLAALGAAEPGSPYVEGVGFVEWSGDDPADDALWEDYRARTAAVMAGLAAIRQSRARAVRAWRKRWEQWNEAQAEAACYRQLDSVVSELLGRLAAERDRMAAVVAAARAVVAFDAAILDDMREQRWHAYNQDVQARSSAYPELVAALAALDAATGATDGR